MSRKQLAQEWVGPQSIPMEYQDAIAQATRLKVTAPALLPVQRKALRQRPKAVGLSSFMSISLRNSLIVHPEHLCIVSVSRHYAQM
jgi:hypothetical protein